jgi:hypothetical protein
MCQDCCVDFPNISNRIILKFMPLSLGVCGLLSGVIDSGLELEDAVARGAPITPAWCWRQPLMVSIIRL